MSAVAVETPATSLPRGTDAAQPLIALDHVSVHFVQRPGMAERLAALFGAPAAELVVQAVSDVSLTVAQGEVVGLVGESGCGKSTLGRVVAGLLAPTEGSVRFRGEDIATMSERRRRVAALAVQMIFQDPFASLNPRMTIAEIIGEAPRVHGLVGRVEQEHYVDETMRRVGLDPSLKRRYPHQFSGGQRQRIGIARALAVKPQFLVCDEAVASLDVSIQAQVINLLEDIQDEYGIAYVFVAHDLSVVRHISDRVAVMYLGHIMELTDRDSLYEHPLHPYTHALLSAVPVPDPAVGKRERILLQGDLPSPINPPSGCVFHTRCFNAQEQCKVDKPALRELRPGHQVACHFPVEKIEGDIIGPMPDDVAPILPDEVERAHPIGTSKELGGEMFGQNVSPTHTDETGR
jgi:peptide/nickel transport system ATP-binding protein